MDLYLFQLYNCNDESRLKVIHTRTAGCSGDYEIEEVVSDLFKLPPDRLKGEMEKTAWVKVWKLDSTFSRNDSRFN